MTRNCAGAFGSAFHLKEGITLEGRKEDNTGKEGSIIVYHFVNSRNM